MAVGILCVKATFLDLYEGFISILTRKYGISKQGMKSYSRKVTTVLITGRRHCYFKPATKIRTPKVQQVSTSKSAA